MNTTPHSACALIINHDGFVLAVSHDGVEQWGLPGGKHEPGETITETAARETKEETGLVVNIRSLIYSNQCGDHYCSTFRGMRRSSDITPETGKVVDWVLPEVLVDPDLARFPEYNRALLQKAGILACCDLWQEFRSDAKSSIYVPTMHGMGPVLNRDGLFLPFVHCPFCGSTFV